MKKILTLFIITFCAVIVTSNAFCTSFIILPETTKSATDAASVTQGVYTDPESPSPDAITLKSAISDFKALSKAEKRERFKKVKASIKQYKKEKKEGKAADSDNNNILAIVFAILIPPVGVLIHEGHVNNKFWIDLLLTLLFFIPGLVYALIVVLSKD